MIDIKLSATELNVQDCINKVLSPGTGGIDVFIGTVRNKTNDKEVLRLHFEAYEKMAVKEMQKIAADATQKWNILNIVIHHRTGTLQVGEIPVIIAVASAHRAAAFEACRYIIDTLKQTVPIWKKEFYSDGVIWVNAHP